jgi:hypothetical protein
VETVGGGKMEWGGKGKGEVSLQATWDQGGRGLHHAKRRKRGVVKGNQQGVPPWLSMVNLYICITILYEYS